MRNQSAGWLLFRLTRFPLTNIRLLAYGPSENLRRFNIRRCAVALFQTENEVTLRTHPLRWLNGAMFPSHRRPQSCRGGTLPQGTPARFGNAARIERMQLYSSGALRSWPSDIQYTEIVSFLTRCLLCSRGSQLFFFSFLILQTVFLSFVALVAWYFFDRSQSPMGSRVSAGEEVEKKKDVHSAILSWVCALTHTQHLCKKINEINTMKAGNALI